MLIFNQWEMDEQCRVRVANCQLFTDPRANPLWPTTRVLYNRQINHPGFPDNLIGKPD